MDAFFSSTFLRYHHPELLRAALLFHGRLHLPTVAQFGEDWLQPISQASSALEIAALAPGTAELALIRYCDFNPELYKRIRKYLIPLHATIFAKDIWGGVIAPMSSGERFFPSQRLLHEVVAAYRSLKFEACGDDLDLTDYEDADQVAVELLMASELALRFRLPYITTNAIYGIAHRIHASGDFSLWEDGVRPPNTEAFSAVVFSDLLPREESIHVLEGFEKFILPGLATVPLGELLDYMDKDKVAPLLTRVRQLMASSSASYSSANVAALVLDEYEKALRVLMPSRVDILINIASSLPTAIFNPFSLIGIVKSILARRQLETEFAWTMVISDLKSMKQQKT